VTSLGDLIAEANRLSSKIDEGVRTLSKAAGATAHAEHAYRMGKSAAWHSQRDGTVPERAAHVDAATADLRLARDMAEGQRVTALEALRSRRAQLSALQSIAAAWRAEAEHAKYGPEVTP